MICEYSTDPLKIKCLKGVFSCHLILTEISGSYKIKLIKIHLSAV